ncbi:MAG: hypothetical protein V4857_14395 [Pseudomonadota bacterium]
MTTRPDTYRASYARVHPLIKHWRFASMSGAVVAVEACPACGGALTMTKDAFTGRIGGHCATPFCVQFTE